MASLTGYRSPCNPKRFRVLIATTVATCAKPRSGYRLCVGLAKPHRRASWRYVVSFATYAQAAEYGAKQDRALGFAVLSPDCVDVDFVDLAGKVLK